MVYIRQQRGPGDPWNRSRQMLGLFSDLYIFIGSVSNNDCGSKRYQCFQRTPGQGPPTSAVVYRICGGTLKVSTRSHRTNPYEEINNIDDRFINYC